MLFEAVISICSNGYCCNVCCYFNVMMSLHSGGYDYELIKLFCKDTRLKMGKNHFNYLKMMKILVSVV